VPPLPSVPSTARFTLRYTWGSNTNVLNRFFMKYTGAIASSDAATLCTTLANSWNTRLAPQYPPSLVLEDVGCLDLGTRTGVNFVLPVTHPGTNAGTGVTAGACFIMSAKVSLRYRGGHPRVYLPAFVTSDLTDSNTWSTAAQGVVFTAFTGMLSDLAASPPVGVGALSQVAVHAYSSNPADFPSGHPTTPPPWPLATPLTLPISSWATNPQVGSQRRRNQQ
jgi:hypothetical protein